MSNVWRWEYRSTIAGIKMVSGGHIQTDVPPAGSEPDGNTIADKMDTLLRANYLAMLRTTDTCDELAVRQEVEPGSGDVPEVGNKIVNLGGGRVSASPNLPPELTAVLRIHTGAAIRSGRGWQFAPPPLNVGALTSLGQILTTDPYGVALAGWAAKLDDVTDTGGAFPVDLNPVVYSRTRRSRGLSYAFRVTSVTFDPHAHFLRTRRR